MVADYMIEPTAGAPCPRSQVHASVCPHLSARVPQVCVRVARGAWRVARARACGRLVAMVLYGVM